jgi:Tol biopolymer transport system component
VVPRKQGRRTLTLLSSDGGDAQPLAPAIDVTSAARWSTDGKWIATGGILNIQVRVGTEHYRFMPDRPQLVYISTPDQVSPENFWLLDLPSKKARQLSSVNSRSTRTFDITPDGTQITFDRLRDNSDIVLIDLPQP